jgi:hypothetical protein
VAATSAMKMQSFLYSAAFTTVQSSQTEWIHTWRAVLTDTRQRIFAPESTGASRVIKKRNLDGKYGLAKSQPTIEVVHSMQY